MILIDGHNLLFRNSEAQEDDVVRMQDEMIVRLRAVSERLGKSMILVFDGTGGGSEYGREAPAGKSLRVVFSGKHMSADDWISAWLVENKGGNHTLVSDDKGLAQRVKRKGLAFAGARGWMDSISPKEDPSSEKKEFGSMEYWLKEFSS